MSVFTSATITGVPSRSIRSAEARASDQVTPQAEGRRIRRSADPPAQGPKRLRERLRRVQGWCSFPASSHDLGRQPVDLAVPLHRAGIGFLPPPRALRGR
jgi:hypothetical protein